MKTYDVAAYVWPSYTGDEIRARQFWPGGFGEWETVMRMKPKFEGHKWPRKPLWGYVNEADPRIMEMQIDAAADHGVNVFIYDWYWYDRRPFLEQCLDNGFLGASNNGRMKFYLMWANHHATYLWDARNSHLGADIWSRDYAVWLGGQDRHEFEIIAKRIIEKYFSCPNYYKIEGKPVFSIYDTDTLIKGLGGIGETLAAFDWFRNETVKAGFPGLHLQIVMRGAPKFAVPGCADAVSALNFDSATHYQMIGYINNWENTIDYAETLPVVSEAYEKFDNECAVPFFPHVSVGWDDNVRFARFKPPVLVNNSPENFERALRNAKAHLDKRPKLPRLLTVNSWNEWTEGSYLQPDDLYGYGYLEAVKRVF